MKIFRTQRDLVLPNANKSNAVIPAKKSGTSRRQRVQAAIDQRGDWAKHAEDVARQNLLYVEIDGKRVSIADKDEIAEILRKAGNSLPGR